MYLGVCRIFTINRGTSTTVMDIADEVSANKAYDEQAPLIPNRASACWSTCYVGVRVERLR